LHWRLLRVRISEKTRGKVITHHSLVSKWGPPIYEYVSYFSFVTELKKFKTKNKLNYKVLVRTAQ